MTEEIIKCPECDSINILRSKVAIVISRQLQDGHWDIEDQDDYEDSDGEEIIPSYTCEDCENEF